MQIYEVAIDTPEKEVFIKARDLTNLCVTAAFHHAYFYRYEQEVKVSYVQKQIVRYWHEGRLPETVFWWALDVVAKRVTVNQPLALCEQKGE